MLLVVGVTFIAIGALATATIAMIYQDRMGPAALRRWLGSEVFCVALAMFIGCGLMILFLFVVEFKTQTFGMAEAGLIAIAVAASVFCVRWIALRHRDHRSHPDLGAGHPA